MAKQEQFLQVIDRDEAERRFLGAVHSDPLGTETVQLDEALGRVLAEDVVAQVDVPSFDRSNLDGFAVRAADTTGADEEHPRRLRLLNETIATAVVPRLTVEPGTATVIATGGMLPRGADAIVMVEHTDVEGDEVLVRRMVTPGRGVAFAGTDLAAAETVLRRGESLTSRETGVLAAIGVGSVSVWRKPRVAIISTGDEIIAPGEPMQTARIYDSNARILADAVREQGGIPAMLGIVPDDLDQLDSLLREALQQSDLVLLSGGTSKGAGDISYRVVERLTDPGIVAHGVALKPGKPICLAATRGKGVVILPGFPTSAIFTYHEFVAPLIRRLAGLPAARRSTRRARMAVKVNSEIGRREYLLVGLVEASSDHEAPATDPDRVPPEPGPNLVAYPMGKGSGSVTTFSRADGFVAIDRHQEIVPAGTIVDVQLLGKDLPLADFVVIGSHCVGLDFLLGLMQQQGYQTKFLAVGSTAGLQAAQRGECDVAGIHLLDAESGQYNQPFLDDRLRLVRGYGRSQGIVYRRDDERFQGRTLDQFKALVTSDPECMMVNRNQGSGTRILIDQFLEEARPPGYAVQSRSHNAVAAAVSQRRADWGVAIRYVAEQADLGFVPLADEQFDFAVPRSRTSRPAVQAFERLLENTSVAEALRQRGLSRD